MKAFTLGTDHRAPYDFTRLLFKHGIQVIFDVRRTLASHEEHFRRGHLETLLSTNGISYVYIGNELGGPRDGNLRAWRQTEEFKHGAEIIARKVPFRVCCILCAERSPRHCHRLAIADYLKEKGIEVVHILSENEYWHPDREGQTSQGERPSSSTHERPRQSVPTRSIRQRPRMERQ